MKTKSTFKCIAIALSILILGTSCGSDKNEDEGVKKDSCTTGNDLAIKLTDVQYKSADIVTGSIVKKGLNDILKVNGKLDVPPQNLVSVSAPLSGILRSTEMLEGLHVKKGDVLAVLEHPDIVQLQENFVEAHNKYNYMEKELARQTELNKENVNSAKVLQQTQSEFNIARAKYKALEEKLRIAGINKEQILNGNISGKIIVSSPIDGYVTKVNVNIGKMVDHQDVMFEIVDTRHLHAELTVYEKDIIKIKEHQKVRFTLANNPGKELSASVYLIGRAFDESRSVRVHCHLDEEDKELLPGMYINAIVELGEQKLNCVPAEAIVRENEKQYVFIREKEVKNATEYHFTAIEVKTGASDGKFVEIIPVKEINTDEQIVIKGGFFIMSQIKMNGEMGDCCK